MAAKLDRLFVTTVYRAPLVPGAAGDRLRKDILRSCRAIAAEDSAGQAWSRAHGYRGYTSYASLSDLAWRDPIIADLVSHLDGHASRFAQASAFDLGVDTLELDSLWINILEPGGWHSGHIHPGSIVSGTYYVSLPKGASGLKFEDPRLAQMMAAPKRRDDAPIEQKSFVEVDPEPGMVLLWESWLRHEVPETRSKSDRVSISFNYRRASRG
jgi:uncharacterized protein (TIGR02466 family)